MILVYDVTNRRSLDHLDTWLAELSKYDGEEGQVGMVKVVVGSVSQCSPPVLEYVSPLPLVWCLDTPGVREPQHSDHREIMIFL